MRQYLITLAAAAAVAACGHVEQARVEAPAVEVMAVGGSGGDDSLRYVGTVEEDTKTAVSFGTAGTVQAVLVREGQRVKAGQLIATLDDRNLRQQAEMARATLGRADDAYRRTKLMYDSAAVPEIKFVEARTALEQAQAAYEIARKNLADARAVAPASGTVGRRLVEPGENVMPSQPVATILGLRTVWAVVPVPEQEMGAVSLGQAAQVTIPVLGGRAVAGRVAEIGVEGSPATHTYPVKIALSNPGGDIRPGMLANVSLAPAAATTGPGAVVVPNGAVQIGVDGSRWVWLARKGRAVRVPVQIGELAPTGVTVTSGLAPGDSVVVKGMQNVSEGAPLKIGN